MACSTPTIEGPAADDGGPTVTDTASPPISSTEPDALTTSDDLPTIDVVTPDVEPPDDVVSIDFTPTEVAPIDVATRVLDGQASDADAPPDDIVTVVDTLSSDLSQTTEDIDDATQCVELAPGDLVIDLGTGAGTSFDLLDTGQSIEIVQGSQGGVHLEVAFRVGLPATHRRCQPAAGDATSCQGLVTATLSTSLAIDDGCCSPEAVGGLDVGKAIVASAAVEATADVSLVSTVLPVIFDETDGALYAGTDCCVTVALGARPLLVDGSWGPAPTLFGKMQIRLTCVDEAP